MKISVGISNRHIHLTEDDYQILFGNGNIEKVRDLHQKGEFASNSFVTIQGSKGVIEHVRVIGPFRHYTQVEVSKTDSYLLGIHPPVRKSGDMEDGEMVTIIGSVGKIEQKKCAIIAERHIHLTKEQSKYYQFDETKTLNIVIKGEKAAILNNVHLKVSDSAFFELHLDTDDSNACNLKNGDIVDIL